MQTALICLLNASADVDKFFGTKEVLVDLLLLSSLKHNFDRIAVGHEPKSEMTRSRNEKTGEHPPPKVFPYPRNVRNNGEPEEAKK